MVTTEKLQSGAGQTPIEDVTAIDPDVAAFNLVIVVGECPADLLRQPAGYRHSE